MKRSAPIFRIVSTCFLISSSAFFAVANAETI